MFTALRFKNPYESMAIDVFKTYSTNFPEDLSVFLDFPFTLPDPNNLDCDRLDDSLFFLFFCFKAPGSCRTIVSRQMTGVGCINIQGFHLKLGEFNFQLTLTLSQLIMSFSISKLSLPHLQLKLALVKLDLSFFLTCHSSN